MARSMKTKTTTKVDTETQPIIEDSVAEEVEEKEVIEAKPQKKSLQKMTLFVVIPLRLDKLLWTVKRQVIPMFLKLWGLNQKLNIKT